MQPFETILIQHGYAPLAAKILAHAPIAPAYAHEDMVEASLNRVANNYYMQCLATYLECFGFNLNRYNIAAAELHYADNLMTGRMGTPPLDNPNAAKLLEMMVVALRKRHMHIGLTWGDVYEFEYAAPTGALVRGSDLLKALLKSNALHNGVDAVHYAHSFGQLTYRTFTMHELMAETLQQARDVKLVGITRFGQVVSFMAVDQIKLLPRAVKHLSKLVFFNVFHMNAHKKIRGVIAQIIDCIDNPERDFFALEKLQQALRAANPYPSMYPEDWQRFISEIDVWLESVTTPYAGAAPQA